MVALQNVDLVVELVSGNERSGEIRDSSGRTPLMLAAHNGKDSCLEALIILSPGQIVHRWGSPKIWHSQMV